MNAVRYLFLMLPALLWPVVFSAHPSDNGETPLSSSDVTWNCPAPAPDTLYATGMTPTSLSLAWSTVTPGTTVYYKVEGYDVSGTGVLPTYITTNTFISYPNLTPGHTYYVAVSASYCPEGPTGMSIGKYFTIPTIIIDDVVELQNPCTPGSPKPTGASVSYSFCVQQSNQASEPYTNGFVGSITYNNKPLTFAVANYCPNAYFGALNQQNLNFDFEGIGNDGNFTEVKCYYVEGGANTHIFTIHNLQYAQVIANLQITFHQNCGYFYSCAGGNPSCPVERQSDGSSFEEASPPILLTQAVPNPFSESTAFRYELTEDAPVQLSLYDATGRLVRTVEHRQVKKAGWHEINIDGAGLRNGVYFLHAMIGQKREVLPLVKLE